MTESSISREKARAILAASGELADYDPLADYYVVTDDVGQEMLVVWGQDMPLTTNRTATSWLSSRYPPTPSAEATQ